jgi:REP element-mobilizing transposase RayT
MRKIPLTLFNPKGAGRPKGRSKHYIPHLKREKIPKQTPVHVTIKINKEYKGLRSKAFLNMLKHAIKKARLKGLAVIHFTVQIDHIHLFLEPKNNQKLTHLFISRTSKTKSWTKKIKSICKRAISFAYFKNAARS